MAGTTVIDQLIVKLGLDPRDFTRGEKTAAAETVKLENQVKKSSEGMGRSFMGFAGKVLGVATAAVALKKFIGYTSELSTGLRQLGIDADNLGIVASELRNWGNVAEMMGGKAEDATKTVGGLSKAVYDLAYNGQISDSLVMLGRLGVQFQDTTGEMRDFKSIVADTQASIQKMMAQGTSRENAFRLLEQAGFDPGLSRAMLQGTAMTEYERQQRRRQVTPGIIGAAESWERSGASRSQAADAASLRTFEGAAAVGTTLNEGAEAVLNLMAGTETLSSTIDKAREASSLYNAAIEKTSDLMSAVAAKFDRSNAGRFPKGRQFYDSTIKGAAKKYGHDPEVLAGLLGTESGFDPTAINSKSGAVGIAQFMPGTAKGRGFTAGQNPYDDIYEAARYLAELKKPHLAAGNDEAAATYLALQDYNAGARGAAEMRAGKRPFAQETQDYPGKVLDYAGQATPTPAAGGNTSNKQTDITFEQITIQTNRTDGDGIAQDFVDGTRRKLNAAQADTGVQ